MIAWLATTCAVMLAAFWAGTWQRWAAGAVLTLASAAGLAWRWWRLTRSAPGRFPGNTGGPQ